MPLALLLPLAVELAKTSWVFAAATGVGMTLSRLKGALPRLFGYGTPQHGSPLVWPVALGIATEAAVIMGTVYVGLSMAAYFLGLGMSIAIWR